jgi:HPt (histidine-containing phosphotransfer) domain-containing protein
MIFNSEELLSRLDNDRNLAECSITIFLEGIDEAVSKLKQAVENQDIEAVTMQAHGLKGASLNSSAGIMAETARRLESGLTPLLKSLIGCYRSRYETEISWLHGEFFLVCCTHGFLMKGEIYNDTARHV